MVPTECDRCERPWTHRPDADSTEALTGRNYLCDDHYREVPAILAALRARRTACEKPSEQVSVAPAVKIAQTAAVVPVASGTSGKPCAICGEPFHPKRVDAKFCGDRCRKRSQRLPIQIEPIGFHNPL
jgi:hypothetical protein